MHESKNMMKQLSQPINAIMKRWGKPLINCLLNFMARVLPGGYRVRPYLQRLRGVKIGAGVWIGDDVYIDEYYPASIEIQDGATIAHRCTLIGHNKGPGRIVIGERAAIGACSVISCRSGQTLTIGEGAVLSAGSIVSNDVPAFTLCGPPRIKTYGTVTSTFREAKTIEEFWRGVRRINVKN
jgi:acetyltransferase-like isoleucine patch superfamily enzyme